ncbi:MAG TPA: DUF1987 domain-containing protein [Flavobacteriales bacterium]
MKSLLIKGTKSTPTVVLDPTNDRYVFAGNSLPENAAEFFEPVIQWLRTNSEGLPPGRNFIFRLSYFSTSSMKAFYMVLNLIREASLMQGKAHTISWQIEDDDEFMSEAAENFEELLGMSLERVQLTAEQATEESKKIERYVDAALAA